MTFDRLVERGNRLERAERWRDAVQYYYLAAAAALDEAARAAAFFEAARITVAYVDLEPEPPVVALLLKTERWLLRRNPNDARHILTRCADALLRAGHVPEAAQRFTRLVRHADAASGRRSAVARQALAEATSCLSQDPKLAQRALPLFRRQVALERDHAVAPVGRFITLLRYGRALLECGKWEEAEAQLHAARAICAGTPASEAEVDILLNCAKQLKRPPPPPTVYEMRKLAAQASVHRLDGPARPE